jgi:hypothetical protein
LTLLLCFALFFCLCFAFIAALKELFNHIGQEEKEILPFLEKKAPKEVLERYGTMFSSMKWTAPTRPHPIAGSVEGLPQAAAGMLAKPIDEATRLARYVVLLPLLQLLWSF